MAATRSLNLVSRWSEIPGRTRLNFLLGAGLLLSGVAGAALRPQLGLVNGLILVVGGVVLSEGLLRLSKLDETDEPAGTKMARMIGNAHQRILVTSGWLDPTVWVEWNDGEIPRRLEERLQKGVEVQIIARDLHRDSEQVFVRLLKKYPQHLHLYKSPVNPVPHGMLIDDLELRLERPHLEGMAGRDNAYIKHPTTAAGLFLATFDRFRAGARPFEPE